jgi:phage/plasmid-associated DNA primase
MGTHNGELWGKVWIKISERNARTIDYNEFKNLTGGGNFRLRRMGENATQSPRTFIFFIMNNGYNGTIQLQGTGKGSEDRRVEPIISNTSLRTRIADHFNLDVDSEEVAELIQDWQQNVWQNETEIAKWLGYIIQKYNPASIAKITPLHAQYYQEMHSRQKNAFNTFMDTIMQLTHESNCFAVDDMHKIYRIATNQPIDKTAFAKRMAAWLTTQSGQNWQVKVRDIYYDTDESAGERHRRNVVYMPNKVTPHIHENKQIFNIFEYIDEDKYDDKGCNLGRKPHVNNIKGDLL